MKRATVVSAVAGGILALVVLGAWPGILDYASVFGFLLLTCLQFALARLLGLP